MNKHYANVYCCILIFAILVTTLSSCTPAATATEETNCCNPVNTDLPTGSFYFDVSSTEIVANPGDITILPLTIHHDISNIEKINVLVAPKSGNQWRFALCYEDLCFVSDGKKPITRDLNLNSNSTLDVEIKYFIPETAKLTDSMTLELSAENTASPSFNKSILLTVKIQ